MSETKADAEAFRNMAAAIERNAEGSFAGACVLVAPDGEIISMLFMDQSAEPALFWGTVKSKIQIALDKLERAEQGAMGFRR